jgi:hypothetical protein
MPLILPGGAARSLTRVQAVTWRRANVLSSGMRREPRSRLPVVATGLAAALLCNFWVLEGLLAKRNDLSGAWISDLAARSQVYGWRFQLLEVAAGLTIAAFAVLLLRREDGAGSPLLRRGLLALLVAGLLAAIGGVAPLNCAEALERACDLSYDPFDLVHTSANLLEAVALAAAFALVGAGLRGRLGRSTLALGGLWLALMAASGLAYLVGDLESAKGLLQRGAQLLLGAWLALLAICSQSP